MLTRSKTISVAAFISLLLLTSLTSSASAAEIFWGRQLRGVFVGSYESTQLDPDKPVFDLELKAFGIFTEVGFGKLSGKLTADWSLYDELGGKGVVQGCVTITAMDGSKLEICIWGIQREGPAGKNDMLAFYSIKGGTGRFEGATGEGGTSCFIDTTSRMLVGLVSGSIRIQRD